MEHKTINGDITITVEKDNKGEMVKKTIERTDGFFEETTYKSGLVSRVFTKYPNGQTELEHFNGNKAD